ncbi:MAG TPA: LacI family DNA-binding transcriptional regulator, partial [Mucilaginibacter sp.]|nr:LacI family DNA-binding transcriptional regulator [Mucilaginibacter sp.]
MYKPATIKDIALALNLSPSTVSRALRDGYEISAETKKLVVAYAEKVNYKSNPIALSLKNKRSYSIGIVVPKLANSFFSQAIAGIESIAHERGYHTIITQTHESAERERANINHLAQRSVDGLLISISSEASDFGFLKTLHKSGLPMVFFDRIIDDIDTFKVTSDNRGGAYNAVESLIKSGKRRIAFLGSAAHLSITN